MSIACSGEAAFLFYSFWLTHHFKSAAMKTRYSTSTTAWVVAEVGLLSEEYDPTRQWLGRSLPQAFSDVCSGSTPLIIYLARLGRPKDREQS